jgi:hypothetical protein
MKITIDISDTILQEAEELASREGTSLRALVEQGLRNVIGERRQKHLFRWRPVASGGRGLRPELQNLSSDEIRDLSYEKDDE